MHNVTVDLLRSRLKCILQHFNLSKEHLDYIVEGLLLGSLRGVDTHGVELLPTYINELEGGRSKTHPNIKVEYKGNAILIDADGAIGYVAGRTAIKLGISACEKNGVGIVSVGNSNHFGMASVYSLEAAKQGYICLVVSNADALIAPFNGKEPLLGTNPLSFAAPGENDDIFCLDIAASQVSYSLVQYLLGEGKPLQKGWAVDKEGNDSADSRQLYALQPFAGYKGQGIAMIGSVLAGILCGMPLDYDMTHLYAPPYDKPRQTGHFFLLINPEYFCGSNHFRAMLQRLMDSIRNTVPSDPSRPVRVPGDIEAQRQKQRMLEGIPISDAVYKLLFGQPPSSLSSS